jgi:acetolactate synthase small subunit
MTHIISMLVENQQGVLARISGLFSGRGYNLESITAGVTTDPTVTRASPWRVPATMPLWSRSKNSSTGSST